MKRWKTIVPAALAVSLAAAPVSSYGAEIISEPGQKYDNETVARMQDNVLEYDEIGLLIDEYNPTLKNLRDTYHDKKDSYKSVDKVKEQMNDAAGDMLDAAQELSSGAAAMKDLVGSGYASSSAYASMLYNSETMNVRAEQYLLSADSMTEMTPEMMKIKMVDTGRLSLISGAQSAMIGYEQLLLQRDSLLDSKELLQAVYDSTQAQVSLGLATQSALLTAKENIQSVEAGILTVDVNLEKIRQSLCTMMGWSYDAKPEILPVPSADLTRIDRMNPETDKVTAIDNNLTLHYNLLDFENLSDNSVEQKNMERTIGQQKTQISSSLTDLYNQVTQKRNEYDTAVSAFHLEQTKMQTAERKYQLKMVSRLEYMQQKNALSSKEIAVKNADLALFQAMETYDWALAGNLSVS